MENNHLLISPLPLARQGDRPSPSGDKTVATQGTGSLPRLLDLEASASRLPLDLRAKASGTSHPPASLLHPSRTRQCMHLNKT